MRLKALTAIIAVILLAGNERFIKAQSEVSLGFTGGIQNTWLYNIEKLGTIDGISYKPTIKWTGGIKTTYHRNSIGIGTEILYSKQGQNYHLQPEKLYCIGGSFLDIHLEYVNIPLYFKYRFTKADKWEFWGVLGGEVSYLLKSYDGYQEALSCLVYVGSGEKRYKSIDYGIIGGLEGSYKINENIILTIGLKTTGGLKKVLKDNQRMISQVENSINLVNRITLGISYNINSEER